jgi:probable HAF family extracellular repeat protein
MHRLASTQNLVATALLLVAQAAGAQATFQGLGIVTVPTGLSSVATAVSDDGSFAVGWNQHLFATTQEATRWDTLTGQAQLLGFVIQPLSFATDVSGDGSVVIGYGSATHVLGQPQLDRGFRWTQASGMQSLGDLPGGAEFSVAEGISADGAIIVGQSASALGKEAFRWTEGSGLVGLGDLPGGAFSSTALAISGDGSTIAGVGTTASGSEVFLWTESAGIVGLGFAGTPTAVSDDGSVVVGTVGPNNYGPNDTSEAFRWSAEDGLVGLGHFPGGQASYGLGVSGDGTLVVGHSRGEALHAFIWDEANGLRRLDQVLSGLGADLTGWGILSGAHDISTDGTWIVGYGQNPSGKVEAWIASIPVPEPEHATMLLSGALALVFLRRRRDHLRFTT